ncbi:MAG: hypothetical protein VYE50_00780 [Candidatus Thermoplasmatota archaeon]|jgi:hypothetical protein|nr:hypothetical protein [Candidatus Thermoplasmatota archaeon]
MKHREISLSNEGKDICSQRNCDRIPKRSLPRKRAEKSGVLDIPGSGRKVSLCPECYRLYKKSAKKARALESLGR